MKLDRKILMSLLLSLLLFLGFLILAHGVYFSAAWVLDLDYRGNAIFRLNLTREVTSMIFWFGRIGTIRNLIYTALFIGAVLLYNKEKRSFLWFGISMAISGGLAPLVVKNAIRRGRPTDGLMLRTGYSFPSGHTMGTLALYGLVIMLAAIYIRRSWLRYTVMISSFAIILIISWSRIHLGVHFLTDIIGSMMLGLSLLIVSWLALSYFRGSSERS